MELVEKKFMEPKELGEIFAAVEGLTNAILHGGKDKWSKAMAELPKVIKAADGLELIKVETKSPEVYEASGAFGGRMTKTIVYKAEAEPTPDDVATDVPADVVA